MSRIILTLALCAALMACAPQTARCGDRPAPVVADHRCADLTLIPVAAIARAKDACKWHYARQSHGRQIMVGMGIIETADPFYRAEWPQTGGSLPAVDEALCIYTAVQTPDGYWRGSGLDVTRSVLDNTPALNISAFCWCTDLNAASEAYVQDYLTAMQTLEYEYPEVTFVYFTGTAEYDGAYGYNRALRNEQIRQFCIANNKVLYDFEDLDSWWRDPATGHWEQATYQYNGRTVPVEHPNLAGNDAEHTSYESCEQKARAAWWLMAVLAGWSGTLGIGEVDPLPEPAEPMFSLACFPNPCNPSTTIEFSIETAASVRLSIYDAAGRLVKTLVDRSLGEGAYAVPWDGTDRAGRVVATGVYFYRLTAGKRSTAKKLLLLR